MLKSIKHTIIHRWIKLRLQPIRVYCFHHVCAEFNEESMNASDWMPIGVFKAKVLSLRHRGVEFISLADAYRHICEDKLRSKKFAVLTFDDGYASLKEILPWLADQMIPCTLFINGKYLDGKSYRKNPGERYLTMDELLGLTSPLIEIGNHGWEHIGVTDMADDEFVQSVEKNVNLIKSHPNYVPFWAYTYGIHLTKTDAYLRESQIVPVYIDGIKNYDDSMAVHRELLNE